MEFIAKEREAETVSEFFRVEVLLRRAGQSESETGTPESPLQIQRLKILQSRINRLLRKHRPFSFHKLAKIFLPEPFVALPSPAPPPEIPRRSAGNPAPPPGSAPTPRPHKSTLRRRSRACRSVCSSAISRHCPPPASGASLDTTRPSTRDASSISSKDTFENPRTLASFCGNPTIRDPFGNAIDISLSPSPRA